MRTFGITIFARALLILLIIITVFSVVLVTAVNGQHASSANNSSEPCYGIMVAPVANATNVPLNTTIVFSWTTSSPPAYVNLQLNPEVPIANITTLVLTVPSANGNTSSTTLCNQSFRYIFSLSQLLKPSTTYSATLLYGEEAQSTQSASWTFTTVSSKQAPPSSLIIAVTAVIIIIIIVAALVVALFIRRNRTFAVNSEGSKK